MAADDSYAQRIKKDAEAFLLRLPDVELILQPVTPASTLDEFVARVVLEKLDEIDCLQFASWCTAYSPEELSEELSSVDLPPAAIERIKEFASKYRAYDRFLMRLHRRDQGYENELTRVSSRPSVQLFGETAMVSLQIFNYDRLLLASSNSLDGLVNFIEMLLDVANDTVESINRLAPKVLPKALDAETISAVLKQAETLRHLTSGLKSTEKPSQD